jgi:hypothetical protein
MRFIILIIALTLLSCGQNSAKEKDTVPHNDSLKATTDSSKSTADQTVVDQKSTPLKIDLNEQLKAKFSNQWHIVNDSDAKWPRDEFDYFIAPKRKTDPDYPYIATGDFNADGKPDHAALVTDDTKTKYQIAILLSSDNIVFWKEDIDLTAISTLPKTELTGIDDKKAKMEGDGINVEYFEKSSFVLYWNGAAFKRIWTGD